MTQGFEAKATVGQWDDDYYHPIALKFYDSAILDMLPNDVRAEGQHGARWRLRPRRAQYRGGQGQSSSLRELNWK
jgi:hypothetical protein